MNVTSPAFPANPELAAMSLSQAQDAAAGIQNRLGIAQTPGSAQQFAAAFAAISGGASTVGGIMGGGPSTSDTESLSCVSGTGAIPGTADTTTVAGLSAEQTSNARTIVEVGRKLGVSDKGIQIALATAMQESGLRNLSSGDRDSVGLFQQRPSAGWGSVAELTDPTTAATKFYLGAKENGSGGLVAVSGWQNMSVTQAAQAVQRSAYPNAYAKWADSAASWLSELGTNG